MALAAKWKITALVACAAVICGAAIIWPIYKKKATERRLAETTKGYRARAEQGDAAAQNSLGYRYHYGQGVPRDDAEALRWYHKAADQGLAKAQFNLGLMYY